MFLFGFPFVYCIWLFVVVLSVDCWGSFVVVGFVHFFVIWYLCVFVVTGMFDFMSFVDKCGICG